MELLKRTAGKLLCPCHSGKYYAECCAKKPNYAFPYHNFSEFENQLRKKHQNFSLKCVWDNCLMQPINSHTIQNNGVLDKLSSSGHLYVLQTDKTRNHGFEFNRIGVNETSIFRCLCGKHDSDIFRPIEKAVFQGNPEQNFLFSLKAVLFNFWKASANKEHWQNEYISKFNIFAPLFDPSLVSNQYHEFLHSYIASQDDFLRIENLLETYKRAYKENNFDIIASKIIRLDYEIKFCCSFLGYIPTLPKGGSISKNLNNRGVYPQITFSCIPSISCSYIILSWLNKPTENVYYNKFFKQIQSKEDLLKVLNVLIPTITEDIFFGSCLVDSFEGIQISDFQKLSSPEALLEDQRKNAGYLNENVKFDLFKKL